MESIKIEFNKSVINTYCPVSLTELCKVFNCKRHGAHLKIKLGTNIKNIWPDDEGNFSIPSKATMAYLIAVEKESNDDDDDEYETETFISNNKSNGRRGNSAFASS